ncbi:hypothetical protein BLA29_007535 [Euroglyphus maynei]|uniref:Uncharacterized protein n=1 Tax=Euroglyphus maynei TaxID=6958 RepID=A0A1Y3BD59_EURMA|nr:hypothetical protein BLA29_007535 [Euroglyphus maynei]
MRKKFGKILYITLFAIVIFLASSLGWFGVIRRSWSLAVVFNGTALLIIMIDVYMTIFDIRFYLISLILTILLLIVNIFLSIDLDGIRRQEDLIRRARIEEHNRRRKLAQMEQQKLYYKSMFPDSNEN